MPTIPGLNFATRSIRTGHQTISRRDRLLIQPADKAKLHQAAVYGLTPQFSANDDLMKQQDHGKGFLATNLDFLQLVKKFRTRLETYGMAEVFTVYPFDPATGLPSSGRGMDLTQDYSRLDQATVFHASELFSFHGDAVIAENLLWSKELLLNSCDDSLRSKIETQMVTLPPQHDTGPVAFYLLATYVVSTSEKVARAITTKLSQMKLHHFEGEDVEQMAATVRGAASRLITANMMPHDMHEIVLEILDSTTVFKFRAYFNTLEAVNSPILRNWQQLLDTACDQYRDLMLKNRWHPTRKRGSGFVAEGSTTTTKATSANATSSSKGKRKNKGQANNATVNTPDGQKTLRTHDRSGQPIDRKAPASGAPKTRTKNDGTTEHWCGRCDWGTGRWGNHAEADHDTFVANQKNRKKKGNGGNGNNSDGNSNQNSSNERRTQFNLPNGSNASTASSDTSTTTNTPNTNATRPGSLLRIPTYNTQSSFPRHRPHG